MTAAGIPAKYPVKNTQAAAAVLAETRIWAAADETWTAAAAARSNPISTFATAPQKAPNHPITAAVVASTLSRSEASTAMAKNETPKVPSPKITSTLEK